MTKETSKRNGEQIGGHERFVLGQRTDYTLFLNREGTRVGYRIGIARGEESANEYVGEDFLGVAVLFAEIVRGEVLPYSLAEITEDFRNGEKIYRDKNA